MAIVHAIGLPENASERKAIDYLKNHLPDDQYVIFHNLEFAEFTGLPYEYDIIVVGEYAVYTLEVKGYSGLIQGNASEWKLDSGAIYKSPIPLTNKKSKVVKNRLSRHHSLLNQVFVWPLVVITDDNARIHLNDDQSDRVLHLNEVVDYILDPQRLPIQPKSISHLMNKICEAILNQFRPLHRQHEIGDYRVIETIGKNNLYTTLLAEHQLIRTQNRFTLKVYNLNLYSSSETRTKHEEWILRDAHALLKLGNHKNIVQAYLPFPWQDNQRVLPMEWIDGYSLRGLFDTQIDIDFVRKIDILRQTAEGLLHAHNHNVIHRDIRPDNIIIPENGPVKLVNFDCARIQGADFQTIATRIGRQLDERYISPEMWQDVSAASPASDLYALGIIFFEFLTGQTPYAKIKELFVAKGLPQMPTKINSSLSTDVDEIISRMCAFSPTERYADLSEAIEDLKIIV